MDKTPQEIRNELLSVFLALDELYRNSPTITTDPNKRIAYMDIQMTEFLLNAIKTIEYHYCDDVPEMRTKRKWGEEMIRAHKLLKKYSENIEEGNPNSRLQLKRDFDDSGYLEL
jgi:hypothetical protein